MNLNLLTEQERLVYMKLMGGFEKELEPSSTKEVKRVRKEKLKPYNLIVTYTCRLCKNTWDQYFSMQWSDEYEGLISVKIEERPLVYITKQMDQGRCKGCRPYLLSKTKEELINIILL